MVQCELEGECKETFEDGMREWLEEHPGESLKKNNGKLELEALYCNMVAAQGLSTPSLEEVGRILKDAKYRLSGKQQVARDKYRLSGEKQKNNAKNNAKNRLSGKKKEYNAKSDAKHNAKNRLSGKKKEDNAKNNAKNSAKRRRLNEYVPPTHV